MSERVDTLLVAVGFVLVVGSALFAGRVAWRLADRAVDWIAAHRPVRERRTKSNAPSEHPAVEDLAQARAAVRRDAVVELQVAAHAQLALLAVDEAELNLERLGLAKEPS